MRRNGLTRPVCVLGGKESGSEGRLEPIAEPHLQSHTAPLPSNLPYPPWLPGQRTGLVACLLAPSCTVDLTTLHPQCGCPQFMALRTAEQGYESQWLSLDPY